MKQERAGVELSRRQIVKAGAMCAGAAVVRPLMARLPRIRIFDVAKYGAVGDGTTFDSPAIQRAINEAAAYAGTAQVLVRGRKKYLIGTIELKGGIDFHLAEDAQLLASTRREDYRDQLSGSNQAGTTAAGGLIVADGAVGLTISGTGSVQGRAREFMERYDDASEWWIPKEFRPKMFVLIGCRHLQVRDITFAAVEAFSNTSQAYGLEAKRSIAPDLAVDPSMVDLPLAVHRGDMVKLMARSNGVSVETTARALHDGRAGDSIDFSVEQTKKDVVARVVDGHTAVVTAP